MFSVVMPDLGEGIVEGEIIQWLKKVGDVIAQDEPIVIIMTDKAMMELPAPHPGKLMKQYYEVGQKAIRHRPLYDIELSITALPKTRKLAKDLGVDITLIPGTGINGRIIDEDVRKHAQASLSGSKADVPKTFSTTLSHIAHDEKMPLRGISSLMAENVMRSHRSIPHFSYFEQIEAENLVQWRLSFKKDLKNSEELTYMPFLIRALSLTIHRYPLLNSSFKEEDHAIILHKKHHIGIAAHTPFGLIVPVLKDVQDKDMLRLIRDYNQLIHKVRANALNPSDMQGGTITISNFGTLGGGLWATPLINSPEAAILATAKIQKQPVVKEDQLIITHVLNVSWSFDHRIIDGAMAASISHYFGSLLQNGVIT